MDGKYQEINKTVEQAKSALDEASLILMKKIRLFTDEKRDEHSLEAVVNKCKNYVLRIRMAGIYEGVEEETEAIKETFEKLPVENREPAFRCVAGYKACKAESQSIEDKVLCGLALVICFAKEVVPLAG